MTKPKLAGETSYLRSFAIIAFILLIVKLALLTILNDLPLTGDEGAYFRNSEWFFDRYWVKHDYWAPLQTAFVAMMRELAGDYVVVSSRSIQLVAHTLTGFFVFHIGMELDDRRTGFWTGVLYLLLPEPVSYSYLLFAETSSNFWFFGSMSLYLAGLKIQKPVFFFTSGIAFAIAALFRSINVYFLPLYLLHFWYFSEQELKKKMVWVLLILAGVAMPLSVQVTKNYKVGSHFLLIDICGASNLWKSHNVFEPPNWDFHQVSEFAREKKQGFPGARTKVKTDNHAENMSRELKNALIFVAENPALTAQRSARKVVAFFSPNLYIFRNFKKSGHETFVYRHLHSPLVRLIMLLPYPAMIALAWAGLVFCREQKVKYFSILLIFYHVGMTAFFFSVSRYRMAITPVLVLFMGWTIVNFGSIRQDKNKVHWAMLIAGLLIILMVILPQFFEVVPDP